MYRCGTKDSNVPRLYRDCVVLKTTSANEITPQRLLLVILLCALSCCLLLAVEIVSAALLLAKELADKEEY